MGLNPDRKSAVLTDSCVAFFNSQRKFRHSQNRSRLLLMATINLQFTRAELYVISHHLYCHKKVSRKDIRNYGAVKKENIPNYM
jgi:hypothetical protein